MFIILNYVCVCAHVRASTDAGEAGSTNGARGSDFPDTEVIGICELPSVGSELRSSARGVNTLHS